MNEFVQDLNNLREEVNDYIHHQMKDYRYKPEDEQRLRNCAAVTIRANFIEALDKLDFTGPQPNDNTEAEQWRVKKELETKNEKNIQIINSLHDTCQQKCKEDKTVGDRFCKAVLGIFATIAMCALGAACAFGLSPALSGGAALTVCICIVKGALIAELCSLPIASLLGSDYFTSFKDFGRGLIRQTPFADNGKTAAQSGLKLFNPAPEKIEKPQHEKFIHTFAHQF